MRSIASYSLALTFTLASNAIACGNFGPSLTVDSVQDNGDAGLSLTISYDGCQTKITDDDALATMTMAYLDLKGFIWNRAKESESTYDLGAMRPQTAGIFRRGLNAFDKYAATLPTDGSLNAVTPGRSPREQMQEEGQNLRRLLDSVLAGGTISKENFIELGAVLKTLSEQHVYSSEKSCNGGAKVQSDDSLLNAINGTMGVTAEAVAAAPRRRFSEGPGVNFAFPQVRMRGGCGPTNIDSSGLSLNTGSGSSSNNSKSSSAIKR